MNAWWDIITDPAHVLAELTFVAVEFVAVWVWVKHHDRRHHS